MFTTPPLTQDEAANIRLPKLSVRFPVETSPFVARAEQHSRQFVRQFGLTPSDAARRHHDEASLGSFMGTAYPNAQAEDLELITDWIACALVMDDIFDGTELGRQPAAMRRYCQRIIGSFASDDSNVHTNGDPLIEAYSDLWQRTTKLMSPTWQKRLIDHFDQFLNCCCWEADNRVESRVPTPEVYRAMRGSGLMPYLDYIEIATRTEIPEHVYRLPFLANLNQAVSDANLWTNDLFSCVQEALGGDVHNFVIVYQHAHGTTFQAAVDAVGAITQERIDQFTSLVDRFLDHDLPVSVPEGLSDVLRAHVHTMCCWLSGQLQWRYKSHRWSRPLHDPASWLGS